MDKMGLDIWAAIFVNEGDRQNNNNNNNKHKLKVVPMGLPGGQNVPTPRESLLALSRGSQLPYRVKIKKHIGKI